MNDARTYLERSLSVSTPEWAGALALQSIAASLIKMNEPYFDMEPMMGGKKPK